MTPASRVAIDPDQVRVLATRMRGGAFILSNSGRALAQSPLPPMPAALSALVSEAICDANAALQDLAVGLIEVAAQLEARATWAELGGGAETAWLIPGLRRYRSLPTAPSTPVADSAALTEEQIRASQEWALEVLDGMPDSVGTMDEEIERLGPGAEDVFGNVVDTTELYADEIPVKALGDFTLAVETAVGGGGPSFEAWEAAGPSAGGGALGTGLSTLSSSPTGWGIVGCLLAGGLVATGGLLEER